MEVKHLDNNTFKNFITENSIAVVDFYASWCGPCKMMAPELEDFAMENSDVSVGKIDVDIAETIANEFRIMSVPTLIYFKNGEVVDKSVGYLTKDEITEIVSKYK